MNGHLQWAHTQFDQSIRLSDGRVYPHTESYNGQLMTRAEYIALLRHKLKNNEPLEFTWEESAHFLETQYPEEYGPPEFRMNGTNANQRF